MTRRLSVLVKIIIISILISSLDVRGARPGIAQSDTITGFPCYRTMQAVYETASALSSANPDLASWLDIGDSWTRTNEGASQGSDLMVLKLTNKKLTPDKPDLVILSGLYARDLAPVELNLRFAELLLTNYGDDPDITMLLDKTDIHLLFVGNPDGRLIAEAQAATGNYINGADAQTKNTNTTTCLSFPEKSGVDLNRNFGYQWTAGPNGCDYDFPGSNSYSESESLAIKEYLLSVLGDDRSGSDPLPAPEDINGLFIHLQSNTNAMFYPYFYGPAEPPEANQLFALAYKLALPTESMPTRYFTGLNNPIYGSPIDYVYGDLGAPALAFYFGGYQDGGYFTNCPAFETTYLQPNLSALIRAAKASISPYQFPSGPELSAITLVPAQEGKHLPWQLSANANSYFNKFNLYFPYPNIQSAGYSIDIAPWESGAVVIPMSPVDGSLDSYSENLFAPLNVEGLRPGRHMVYLQAVNADGYPGFPGAAFLDLPFTIMLPLVSK